MGFSHIRAKLWRRFGSTPVTRLVGCLIGWMVATCLVGCVHIPKEQLSSNIEQQELSDHVKFLAQPALKGRKPGTIGSWNARRYIKKRFETYGLIPWGKSKGYEQSFGLGTNLIGVLPGEDDTLADEIVLVCAHYDHLGTDKKGKPYLGAGDNASGVSALLEIAERLALGGRRPRRSVAFAAFDSEEMFCLGAFAFTCREDFDKKKIVAVVNIDILGRDFFDVMDNTLFAVGTEHYPGIREDILQAAAEAQLRVLPLGTDVVGPRGDHVAFESMQVPCLFFSSGQYKDYHKTTDTPDKLDYAEMRRQTKLIFQTVQNLTNVEKIERPVRPQSGDLAELRSIRSVLGEISKEYEQVGLTAEDSKTLAQLASRTDDLLLDDNYTLMDRRNLIWGMQEIVMPLLIKIESPSQQKDKGKPEESLDSTFFLEYFNSHRVSTIEAVRQLVKQSLEHKPGLFAGSSKFSTEVCELSDEEISFVEAGNGQYRLSVFLSNLKLQVELRRGLLKPLGHFAMECTLKSSKERKGTKEEIIDAYLLMWRHWKENESDRKGFDRVPKKITGQDHGTTYNQWLQWRLSQTGHADETHWLLDLLKSKNSTLLYSAIAAAPKIASFEDYANVLSEIVLNHEIRPDVRSLAIGIFNKNADKKALLVLVGLLDDVTLCKGKEYSCIFDTSYPFYHHPWVRLIRKWEEKQLRDKGKPTETIADVAQSKLEKLTGQDFGKDAHAWEEWIEKKWKPNSQHQGNGK